MKEIEVFAAKGFVERDEYGRGAWFVIGYFENRADALKAAAGQYKAQYGQNRDGQVEKIKVFKSYEDYQAKIMAEVKDKALKKLDQAEKEVLGL